MGIYIIKNIVLLFPIIQYLQFTTLEITHTHMRSLIYGTGMYCKRVCKPFRSTATNTCRQTLTSTHLNR